MWSLRTDAAASSPQSKQVVGAIPFSQQGEGIQTILLRGVAQQVLMLDYPKLEAVNFHFKKIGLTLVPISAVQAGTLDAIKLVLNNTFTAEKKLSIIQEILSKHVK